MSETETPQGMQEKQEFIWMNLLSTRAVITSVVVGLIPALLLSLIWSPLSYIFFPVALLAWIGQGFGPALRCPKCKKRVKMGATRCHHCGYDTV